MEVIRKIWAKNIRMVIWVLFFGSAIVGMERLFGRYFFWAVGYWGLHYVMQNYGTLRKTRLKDWVNPVKWLSVMYATLTKMLFPMHIIEQLVLRIYDPECNECVKSGHCKHCSCDMSKVYVPFDRCSADHFLEMVEDEREYRALREQFPVEVTVRYPEEEKLLERMRQLHPEVYGLPLEEKKKMLDAAQELIANKFRDDIIEMLDAGW